MSAGVAAVLAAVALLLAVGRRRAPRVARLARDGRLAGAGEPADRRAATLPVLRRLLPAALLAAVAALVWAAGVVLGVAAAVVAGVAVVLVRDWLRRRQVAAHRRDLRTALRILVGELEVGAAPAAALRATAAAVPGLGEPLTAAAGAAEAGADPGQVLAQDADPDLRLLGAAWRVSTATGAALTGVLARIAADLAAVDAQRRAVAGALAGPRSSALVLAGLPVLGLALGAGMGARPGSFLLDLPAGRLLCCAGVVLDASGILWMRALLRRAERP